MIKNERPKRIPLTPSLSPSDGERFHELEYANRALEPTPYPSKEGSGARWIVPLLGGVRGGWVGGRFMGRVAEGRVRGFVRDHSFCRSV